MAPWAPRVRRVVISPPVKVAVGEDSRPQPPSWPPLLITMHPQYADRPCGITTSWLVAERSVQQLAIARRITIDALGRTLWLLNGRYVRHQSPRLWITATASSAISDQKEMPGEKSQHV